MSVTVTGLDRCDKRGLRNRLNLIAAAEVHVVWKNRLGNYVRGGAPVEDMHQDRACPLGILIDGAAFSALRELDEYRHLSEAHRDFHLLSSLVVEKLESDDRAGAASLFENEYSLALRDILLSLSRINRLLMEA